VKRAAETIGWDMRKAYDRLPTLTPGEFVATGPAFSLSAVEVLIGEVRSRHAGAAPKLAELRRFEEGEAHSMLDLDELVELSQAATQEASLQPGFKAVRAFIRDPSLLLAAQAFDGLRAIMPDGSTIDSLAKHLKAERDDLLVALALLESYAAVEIEGEAVRVSPKFFWEKPQ
jgi:hypothetical protein